MRGSVSLILCCILAACSGSSGEDGKLGSSKQTVIMSGAGLRFLDARGSALLETITRPNDDAGVPFVALGFSTAPEPEFEPPSLAASVLPPTPATDTRHRPTTLRSLQSTASGLSASFETDDPTGRVLTITTDETEGLVHLDVTLSPADGITGVYAAFKSPSDELFHGLGGRRESTNSRGRTIVNWVLDYRFPNLETAYYYAQPIFLSSRGYAVSVETDALATLRLGSDDPLAWRLSVAEPALHLTLAMGDAAATVARISARTGRHRVSPDWSMGPMLSRTVKVFEDTPEVYRGKVEDDLTHILDPSLRVESYAYEGWAHLPADFVRSTNMTLRAHDIHPVLYLRSMLSNDGAETEPSGRIDEAIAKGFVARHEDGSPYLFTGADPRAQAAVVDFTNPAARSWWKSLVRELLDLGADGFMDDFGEQVLADMHFFDGNTGKTMHNHYPVLQHQASREALDEYATDHPERQLFFFVRSGYSGAPGSAAYENASFPGDESADWKAQTGLPSIVPDMLNRALFGAYGFSTDIGGYADYQGTTTDEELFVRWLEAAVFTSHFRVHNAVISGVHMPWSFGASTEDTWREMAALHLRVRPLIASLWRAAETTGVPPVRPIWFDEFDPSAGTRVDDEWMVGSDVLVAPVLQQGAVSRNVWFPRGCWQLHGEPSSTYMGPSEVAVEAPLRVLPWFTRCGSSPLPLP